MSDIKLVLGGRRTGRTSELLEWLLDGQINGETRAIFSHSHQETERLYKLAVKLCNDRGLQQVKRGQFRSYAGQLGGDRITSIAIDNVELMLRRVTGTVAPLELVIGTLAEDTPRWGHIHGFDVHIYPPSPDRFDS